MRQSNLKRVLLVAVAGLTLATTSSVQAAFPTPMARWASARNAVGGEFVMVTIVNNNDQTLYFQLNWGGRWTSYSLRAQSDRPFCYPLQMVPRSEPVIRFDRGDGTMAQYRLRAYRGRNWDQAARSHFEWVETGDGTGYWDLFADN